MLATHRARRIKTKTQVPLTETKETDVSLVTTYPGFHAKKERKDTEFSYIGNAEDTVMLRTTVIAKTCYHCISQSPTVERGSRPPSYEERTAVKTIVPIHTDAPLRDPNIAQATATT